jgi:hypothetical protein
MLCVAWVASCASPKLKFGDFFLIQILNKGLLPTLFSHILMIFCHKKNVALDMVINQKRI